MPVSFHDGEPVDGFATFSTIDLDETPVQIKARPGVVHGYFIANRSASEVFVKFFDGLASDVAVGTTVPALVVPLQPRTAANVAGLGAIFTTGICVAAVTGVRDDARSGPSDNEVIVNLTYA